MSEHTENLYDIAALCYIVKRVTENVIPVTSDNASTRCDAVVLNSVINGIDI